MWWRSFRTAWRQTASVVDLCGAMLKKGAGRAARLPSLAVVSQALGVKSGGRLVESYRPPPFERLP
eukprot:7917756-Pyramimonas_sp.AAC.1